MSAVEDLIYVRAELEKHYRDLLTEDLLAKLGVTPEKVELDITFTPMKPIEFAIKLTFWPPLRQGPAE